MSTYSQLRDKISAKLSGISKIVEVVENPELDFEQYPVATITPAEGSADWETNREDLRTYAYQIDIFYPTKETSIGVAVNALYDLMDDVLDSFTGDKQFSGLTLADTNKTIMTVRPVSSGWGEVIDKDLIFGTIKIFIDVSVQY